MMKAATIAGWFRVSLVVNWRRMGQWIWGNALTILTLPYLTDQLRSTREGHVFIGAYGGGGAVHPVLVLPGGRSRGRGWVPSPGDSHPSWSRQRRG